MDTEKSRDKFRDFRQNMEQVCKLSSIKPTFDSATNSINCSFASQSDIEKYRKSNHIHGVMGKTQGYMDKKRVKSPTPEEIMKAEKRKSDEVRNAGIPLSHLSSIGSGLAAPAGSIEIAGEF